MNEERNNVTRFRKYLFVCNGKITMRYVCIVEPHVTVNNTQILSTAWTSFNGKFASPAIIKLVHHVKCPIHIKCPIHVKSPIFLWECNKIWSFLDRFSQKSPLTRLQWNLSSGSHGDICGQTDGHVPNRRRSRLRECASKKTQLSPVETGQQLPSARLQRTWQENTTTHRNET